MRLTYQNLGEYWAVGMEGQKKEMEPQWFSFYNHEATDAKEPIFHTDTYWTFFAKPDRLKKYFINAARHELLNQNPMGFKGKRGGVDKLAHEIGLQRFNSMVEEKIVQSVVRDVQFFKTAFFERELSKEQLFESF
jgi:hypothetical protein